MTPFRYSCTQDSQRWQLQSAPFAVGPTRNKRSTVACSEYCTGVRFYSPLIFPSFNPFSFIAPLFLYYCLFSLPLSLSLSPLFLRLMLYLFLDSIVAFILIWVQIRPRRVHVISPARELDKSKGEVIVRLAEGPGVPRCSPRSDHCWEGAIVLVCKRTFPN